MTSSPLRPGASLEEELDYYKKQYEQLETDLADFQASSKELEEQLERDIEAAEKNERKLKQQIEKLKYEGEEWKTKHHQSKTEANSAQNALQKEITTLREQNRGLGMRLRDIEVVNDDYERQARNTESSLEDMESRCNVAIERGVMLEEELKTGEQEREALRIENQRVRDELGDLKVESEITLEKLRMADETIERLRSRKPSPLAVESLRARSPAGSEVSGVTPESPTASTPPPSKSDSASEIVTPPSPPLSDTPTNGAKTETKTPVPPKRRSLIPDAGTTPRPGLQGPRTLTKHSRGPSAASSGSGAAAPTSDAKAMRPPARPRQVSRPSNLGTEGLPRSDSLYQIRSLRGRMQKIEERVHSARSKLPAQRTTTTPKGSPSTRSEATDTLLPSSITMRRSIKRPSSNLGVSSQADGGASEAASETATAAGGGGRRESQISKRLSFGIPRPSSVASNSRPASALDRPPSAASSRASLVNGTADLSASTRTPLAHPNGTFGLPARSSSSISGNYATVHGTPRRNHRPSASISELRRKAAESEDSGLNRSPTAGRRTTLDRSGLPTTPAGYGTVRGKRVSGATSALQQPKTATRPGSKDGGGLLKKTAGGQGVAEEVGETY